MQLMESPIFTSQVVQSPPVAAAGFIGNVRKWIKELGKAFFGRRKSQSSSDGQGSGVLAPSRKAPYGRLHGSTWNRRFFR
uniref:Uncharacterized protein n=1 Tax=Knipowitschia caucasica TaxID=637954 RepID=A0AAV2J0B8_KNICA